jgi:hypothetical protein
MGQKAMENSSLVSAIEKLAIAGEQAGFTVEQMIQLLNDGLTVETLLDLISRRHRMPNAMTPASSAHWVPHRLPCGVN